MVAADSRKIGRAKGSEMARNAVIENAPRAGA